MKKLILLFVLACGGGPEIGECHEIKPVWVTDECGREIDLTCECWTGVEWLADCPIDHR